MAGAADIFNMFRGGNNQSQQAPNPQQNNQNNQQQQPNPGNMDPQNRAGGQSNNVNDPNSSQNQTQNQNNQPQNNQNQGQKKSPLAEFADLWETTPVKEGETPQTDWNDHSSIVPEMNIDPKRLYESAKRIDFSKVMDPAKVQAALKGDANAFGEVINTVAQAAFANMAMSTTRIVKAMTGQMAEKLYSGALPHHFRKNQVNAQIDADLPILSDPAVAPMFENLKEQLRVKYPKASAQEISAKAKQMVTSFADAVKGGSGNNQGQNQNRGGPNSMIPAGEDIDWLDFAGMGTNQNQQ